MKEFNQLELFELLEMFFEECRQVRLQAPPPRLLAGRKSLTFGLRIRGSTR